MSSRTRIHLLAAAIGLAAAGGVGFLIGRDTGNGTQDPSIAMPSPSALASANGSSAVDDVHSLAPNEQLDVAFQAAFGRRGKAVKEVDGSAITYTPARLIWIGDRAALISLGQGDTCHSCTGAISVHYLAPDNGGFRVTGTWLTAAGGSTFGSPASDWGISEKFAANPVIFSEGGGTWQGYTCAGAGLIELRPSGPTQIAKFPTGYSDSGAIRDGDQATEIEGKVANIRKGRSFDMVYSGTQRFTEHYEWKGSRFVLTKSESQVPTC